jgi:hypothetical protein
MRVRTTRLTISKRIDARWRPHHLRVERPHPWRRPLSRALTARQPAPCDPRFRVHILEEAGVTDGECRLGACTRVALVSMTVSASFGLAGCAAIDDLKVSISQWFNIGNLTGGGEVPYVNASGATRVIPPENIPKQAAKAPRKKIKATARKLQRPRTVVLPARKAPMLDFPEAASPGETEGQSAPSTTMRSRTTYPKTSPSFDGRFCPECWGLPAKAE